MKSKKEYNQLYTKWGEKIDSNHVLQEYPRPNMKRNSYVNLNGLWKYAVTNSSSVPSQFDGEILVPFSPESVLSGVGKQLQPDEVLWYSTNFRLKEDFNIGTVLLHFGAVDQYCSVYINQKKVGNHRGGYLPFSLDISDYLLTSDNNLMVMVKDFSEESYHSIGKQKIKRGGMFYTAQSGIWQTVWMESVPENYMGKVRITPLYDESSILIEAISKRSVACKISIYDGTNLIQETKIMTNQKNQIVMDNFKSWSPENPYLYTITMESDADFIESYFAMRKCSVEKDEKGILRLFLNNKPYFHNGVLDQGYWPDGLYTAPSDEALAYDVLKMKDLGFNMIRKHVKIEALRWYYHCDKIGMLVWQDMVNGGESYNIPLVCYLPNVFHFCINQIKDNHYGLFARKNINGRKEYTSELKGMIELLYNHPSIVMWVPFNEGWGQFDAEEAFHMIQKMDQTRTIDHASGWYDQNIGEVKSVHIYFRKIRIRREKRAVILSEFGGYSCLVKNHSFGNKVFGYRKYKGLEALTAGYKNLYEAQIIPSIINGLAATVYTQVSDVEDEVNGLLTYDRKILKMEESVVKELNHKINYS